jgi:hypothetical protein
LWEHERGPGFWSAYYGRAKQRSAVRQPLGTCNTGALMCGSAVPTT